MKDYLSQDKHISQRISIFPLLSRSWDSLEMLGKLGREDITLPQSQVDQKKDFFLHAAYTEFDADNFCKHLNTLAITFSDEFKLFERVWRKDELNHYIGFRYLYSILYGSTVEEVGKIIETRKYDFSRIEPFFRDEFTICLLIAFDEILTAKGYGSEQNLYASLGSQTFSEWFKLVTMDEAYHFRNIMEVIRLKHSDRINEIPTLIERFIEWDVMRNDYSSTFVLDHDYYSLEFIKHGASIIRSYFI